MRFQVHARVAEATKQTQNLQIQVTFFNESKLQMARSFKSANYVKAKPYTHYVIVADENVLAFQKLNNSPNGGEATFTLPVQNNLNVIVESDLMIGLGLNFKLSLKGIGSNWALIFDSKEDIEITIE